MSTKVKTDVSIPSTSESAAHNDSLPSSSGTASVDQICYCRFCGETCADNTSLVQHLLSHLKSTSWRCSACLQGFDSQLELQQHMPVHKDLKKHPCVLCNKSFDKWSAFISHMKIHCKLKPYSCRVCSKSFAQSSTLSQHILSHSDVSCIISVQAFMYVN